MAIKTATYESVMRGTAGYAGVKRQQLLDGQSTLLFPYISDRYMVGMEAAFMSEITCVEKRYDREGLWVACRYAPGAIVWFGTDDVYY